MTEEWMKTFKSLPDTEFMGCPAKVIELDNDIRFIFYVHPEYSPENLSMQIEGLYDLEGVLIEDFDVTLSCIDDIDIDDIFDTIEDVLECRLHRIDNEKHSMDVTMHEIKRVNYHALKYRGFLLHRPAKPGRYVNHLC